MSMIKVSETLAMAGGNLARPTKFSALIAPPHETIGIMSPRVFDVLCKSVKIPDTTMEPIDIQYKGHTLKYPGRVNQELQVEVTMYLDEHHYLRAMFDDWLGGIDQRFYAVSSDASAAIIDTRNIYGTLLIKTRDFEETTGSKMEYFFDGLYPISVSGPEFGSASVGEVSEFTVNFGFYRMLSGSIDGDYDGVDDYLDTIGASPLGYAGGGSISNFVDDAFGAFGSVNNAISSVKSWF